MRRKDGRMGRLEDVRLGGWKGQREEIISNAWNIAGT